VTITEKKQRRALEIVVDLKSALTRLQEALELEETLIVKDGSIQRFEFTFELCWKLMQAVARFKDGKTTGSVRDSIRTGAQLGIVENSEPWFDFHDARNQASHTYDIEMADEVYQKIKSFPPIVSQLIESVEETLAEGQPPNGN